MISVAFFRSSNIGWASSQRLKRLTHFSEAYINFTALSSRNTWLMACLWALSLSHMLCVVVQLNDRRPVNFSTYVEWFQSARAFDARSRWVELSNYTMKPSIWRSSRWWWTANTHSSSGSFIIYRHTISLRSVFLENKTLFGRCQILINQVLVCASVIIFIADLDSY